MKPNIYLEAPNNLDRCTMEISRRAVFLAGSITGAKDWQAEAAGLLLPHFHVFNPRRRNFDVKDASVEREQISWEYRHLAVADIILFYFSDETLAPITLFEYGKLLVDHTLAEIRARVLA